MKTICLIGMIFLSIFITPAFAQYSPTNPQLPIPSQLQGMSNAINSTMNPDTNGKGITNTILIYIQQFVNSIIGTANIQKNQNPIGISSEKLQGVSNSGFKLAGDLTATGWDLDALVYTLINSFSPFQIPFWLILGISGIATLIILVKIGKIVFKRGIFIIGIILFFILILTVIGIRNAVIS